MHVVHTAQTKKNKKKKRVAAQCECVTQKQKQNFILKICSLSETSAPPVVFANNFEEKNECKEVWIGVFVSLALQKQKEEKFIR